MASLPNEILEMILLDAAVLKARPMRDDYSKIYGDLAAVCGLWKDILDGDHFRRTFRSRLRSICKSTQCISNKRLLHALKIFLIIATGPYNHRVRDGRSGGEDLREDLVAVVGRRHLECPHCFDVSVSNTYFIVSFQIRGRSTPSR